MTSRDTGTGDVLEAMVLPSLARGGYDCRTRVTIGQRLGCGKHIVDVVATKGADSFLVSLKWQQVSGTAEQKVPYETICLAEAVESGAFQRAYLVLGGEGWKLRAFYTGGGLRKHLALSTHVEIMTLESFVARANQGKL